MSRKDEPQAAGVTGVLDVTIDGDEVTQAEYGGGEPADPEFPVVYRCTKQEAPAVSSRR